MKYGHVRSMRFQHGNLPAMGDIMRFFQKKTQAAPNATPDTSGYKFDPVTGAPIERDANGAIIQKDPNAPPAKSPANPLDQFSKLWDTPDPSKKAVAPSFSLNPDSLKQLINSQDFTANITPELQQKLKSGDAAAVTEAMNEVARSAYGRIFEQLPQLTEAYVGARLQHDRAGVDQSVRKSLTKQHLDKLAENNPVLKRQLEVIGEGLLEQFPDAQPDWIAAQVPIYFTEVTRQLNPDAFKPGPDAPKGPDAVDAANGITSKPVDWGKWMSGQGTAAPQDSNSQSQK